MGCLTEKKVKEIFRGKRILWRKGLFIQTWFIVPSSICYCMWACKQFPSAINCKRTQPSTFLRYVQAKQKITKHDLIDPHLEIMCCISKATTALVQNWHRFYYTCGGINFVQLWIVFFPWKESKTKYHLKDFTLLSRARSTRLEGFFLYCCASHVYTVFH